MKTTIFIISFFLFTSCSGNRKIFQNTDGVYDNDKIAPDSTILRNLIESGSFEFAAKRVTGQQLNISTGYYFLRIDHNKAEAYLPFFGESKRYDFTGEGGIIFNSLMADYKLNYNTRKKYYSIEFRITDPRDQYQIYMDIYSLDLVSLRITGNNKSPMTYTGTLSEIIKPKSRTKNQK
jgi:hypothetical protein